MSLILKSEIIARAFTRALTESRIQDDVVSACETKYIKPILGKDFYVDVVASPANYTTLLTNYIKPVLAWWVRYMILPELRTELSDLGIISIQIQGGDKVDDELFAQIRDNTRIIAEEKEALLTEYLVDNSSLYPLYFPILDPGNQVDISGGIIMKKTNKAPLWQFDDGPEYWRKKY